MFKDEERLMAVENFQKARGHLLTGFSVFEEEIEDISRMIADGYQSASVSINLAERQYHGYVGDPYSDFDE